MTTALDYINIINAFAGKRILVLGDLMLDVYLRGNSRRLCPEAPVPVVNVHERSVLPGGAGNTVCNLRALGADVDFCSLVGEDAAGEEALALLEEMDVNVSGLVQNVRRHTVTKTRVVAGEQVITRFDQGSEQAADADSEERILKYVERLYPCCHAVVISDYHKGVLTPRVLDALIALQRKDPKFIAVDSKRLPFFAELKPSYIKPNYEEAIQLLSLPAQSRDRVTQLDSHARRLFKLTRAPYITVTLDAEGSLLIEDGKVTEQIAAPQVLRPHVAGAGDTYFSAFTLAYLTSSDARTSARIATAASAIAVKKEGTASCSASELKGYYNRDSKFIPDVDELRDLCEIYHRMGRRIVFTNGCFDILHSGHVAYLRRARELGDILIVGLNTDDSIRRIKGELRPINGLADRLQVLAGLSSVDHIVPFGDPQDDTPVPLIKVVRPHIFAKGGDYTKEKLPEAETVEACGGQIVFLEHVPDHSTTRIISRIANGPVSPQKLISEASSR